MRMDEDWAVAPERVCAFFREQEDVREVPGGFCFRNCAISLEPSSGRAMGRWELPRTRLVFEGDDGDVQAIHRRFFLRFLSAGG